MVPWESQALSHADTWRPQLVLSDVPAPVGSPRQGVFRSSLKLSCLKTRCRTSPRHPLSGPCVINDSSEGCKALPAVSFFHVLCPCNISALHRCCKSFRCCSGGITHCPVNLSPPLQELLVPGSALQQAIPRGKGAHVSPATTQLFKYVGVGLLPLLQDHCSFLRREEKPPNPTFHLKKVSPSVFTLGHQNSLAAGLQLGLMQPVS